MSTYLFGGFTIVSDFAISELPCTNCDNGEFSFSLGDTQQQSNSAVWSHSWLSGNHCVLSYRSQDSYHWLRFPALADFQISDSAKEISCYPTPGISQETISHLLLDQVLPRCLAHQGKIMVHASAVQLEQGLVLFLGDSGAGKSTLAGNFHQAGDPAVSDDCVWIKENQDQVVAVPSYGGLRLWEDSLQALFLANQNTSAMAHYTTKRRLPLHENNLPRSGDGIPILAMIMLTSPEQISAPEVTLERLSGREAFIALLKQTFQLDPTDLKCMVNHMNALGCIVPSLPAFCLSMPHDYALLPLVRQKILEAVL